MAVTDMLVHINMNGNEIQNVLAQKLASAPSNPSAGQFYFNTNDNTLYVYNGTTWLNALAQGTTYTNGAGINITSNQISISLATGDNAGNVTLTTTNGLAANIASATTSNSGIIEIATDSEATAGTATNLAVTPKQLATKVNKLSTAPTAGAFTKVTINADGLVTSGGSLTSADVTTALGYTPYNSTNPSGYQANIIETVKVNGSALTPSSKAVDITVPTKISDLTDDTATSPVDKADTLTGLTASIAELNIMDGVTVTAAQINSVTSKIDLSSLSIDSGSSNYLGYDSSTGKFSAKVDTTVTDSSTKLVTSGAVATAIANAIVGGVVYKGTWAITTSTTDYSGITLPVKKGYMYYVTGTGTATVGGIEWNPGDYLLVNADVAAGGSLSGKVEKIDNTEAADIVRLNATQTLTNKTIDADDNTISDLATGNFKSGVIVTSVGSTGADTSIPTEKAVRSAISTATTNMVTTTGTQTLTNKTIDADNNTISDLSISNFKSGVIVDSTSSSSSTTDTEIYTAAATDEKINSAISTRAKVINSTNTELTASAGVVTWTITNSISSANIIAQIYETTTNKQIFADVVATASTITIKMNSTNNIPANKYRAIIIGV